MSANSGQAWRRWFGLLFLALSFGMLVWGQTFLKNQLQGVGFLIYWSICFLFTLLAIATALLDMLLVRRQCRIDRRDVLRKAFSGEHRPVADVREKSDQQPQS
jgi:hypothetical protein